MKVIKRDGQSVSFDSSKISQAIIKAMVAVGNVNASLATKIAEEIENCQQDLNVEEIQNIVERKLMASNCKDVAKAYIVYRHERSKERERNSELIQKIWERINVSNVENSNANVDEKSFSGREKEASSDAQKMIALDYVISKDVSDGHKEGLIYLHDLEKYNMGVHNCLNVDFSHLFEHGFATRNGDVRPPSTFSTACQQVAVIFQCQSQVQFGGVGSVHIDYDLAPFVKKSFAKHYKVGLAYIEGMHADIIAKIPKSLNIDDADVKNFHARAYKYAMDMLEREGEQAAQGLYHNLNTLESRQGSQVPFTSINFGRDTTPEGRLVTKWMLNASIDGIGKYHTTSIFPISIFQYKKGVNVNPDDPNYDLKQLALKSMSKRIYPNWVNCDWSQANEDPNNIDTYFGTMGCRTMLGRDRHGLEFTRVGRGNNIPTTIILPKLGIEYGICFGKRTTADLDGFWNAFEDTLKLAEKSLMERFEIMAKQSPKAAPFMYDNGTIKDADKCANTVYEALKHNTFTIGYIGIAELCQALFGENHVHNKEIHNFALRVVKRINTFCKEASERNDLNFACYATPAEGLCHVALKTLRNQYGSIPFVTDREYLTNSHHVPVWENVSIWDKLTIEAPFCKYPTGGCITYIELESTFVNNLPAIEEIIDFAFNLDIPYLAFNFAIDTCLDCGYQGEFNDKCPVCDGQRINQLRRVTGYLTSDYRNFNKGKQAETLDRVKHSAHHKL